ncbi:MAG: hypothetical protein ABIH18_04310 [Candidatus Omnitrophota bacterium]
MVNNKAKAPVIVLIILLIISISLAGTAFYSLQKEQTKTLALQQDLGDLKAKHKIVEKKLQDAQNSIPELEAQLRNSNTLITELKTKLESEKNESGKILSEKERIQSDLEQQKKLRSELENRYLKIFQQNKKIQQQVEELISQKNELEKKLEDIGTKAEGIELGKIVVGLEDEENVRIEEVFEGKITVEEQQEEPVVEEEVKEVEVVKEEPVIVVEEEVRLEGKVLVVNKDYDFAVIDIGSSDGVKLDDIFSVYQQDNKNLSKKRYIGDLKIEKVHESMSAAGFVNNRAKNKINEGDIVILKKK